MISYESFFFGDCSDKGFAVSYLLISRKIKHTFIISDDIFSFSIITVNKNLQVNGFENIIIYLNNYIYVYDFPEISNWN